MLPCQTTGKWNRCSLILNPNLNPIEAVIKKSILKQLLFYSIYYSSQEAVTNKKLAKHVTSRVSGDQISFSPNSGPGGVGSQPILFVFVLFLFCFLFEKNGKKQKINLKHNTYTFLHF